MPLTFEERFRQKIRVDDDSGCHIWRGSRNVGGYGRLTRDGAILSAHRVAWELANGPIPDGKVVLHKCDNPLCVNPEHLSIGTQKENVLDAIAKGRHTTSRRNTPTEIDPKIDLNDLDSLGPAMQSCTPLERRFAYCVATGIADSYTEAARTAGYGAGKKANSSALRVRAHEALSRDRVKAAVKEVAGVELAALAGLALRATRDILLNPRSPDLAKVAGATLNRLGWGERQSVDVAVTAEVKRVDRELEWINDVEWC